MQSEESKIAKAVLYYSPHSVESSTVLLALEEKGFGSDEIELKRVDLVSGENFDPTYLRISATATVPALVVPLEKSLAPDTEVRYKAINDTKAIVEFLDKSRSVISKTHTTSSAPAPALAPASIALAAISAQIIDIVWAPATDPERLYIAATTPAEIAAKSDVKHYLTTRQAALEKHIAAPRLSQKTVAFLQGVSDANKKVLSVYNGKASSTDRDAFFASAKKTWSVDLKADLDVLETLIVGPYSLGDQLSLPDLHLATWLARAVHVAGGKAEKEGIDALEAKIGGGWKVGDKLGEFWDATLERPSFKKVYADGLH